MGSGPRSDAARKALSDASLNAFNRLVAALPDDARVFQVGVMCSRPRAPLRICVIGQEWNETLDFLALSIGRASYPRFLP